MIKKLRKINLKTAIYMALVFYFLTILIHLLVISEIIPYTWVNGGRSESFAAQLQISIISTIITFIGGFLTVIVGRNIHKYKRGTTIICWFIVALLSFGFMQQLLGTPFEKMVCTLILLLGLVSNLRMAIENNGRKN